MPYFIYTSTRGAKRWRIDGQPELQGLPQIPMLWSKWWWRR